MVCVGEKRLKPKVGRERLVRRLFNNSGNTVQTEQLHHHRKFSSIYQEEGQSAIPWLLLGTDVKKFLDLFTLKGCEGLGCSLNSCQWKTESCGMNSSFYSVEHLFLSKNFNLGRRARILEWVAIYSSRGYFQPGIKSGSPALQADSLPSEPPGRPPYFSLRVLIRARKAI